MKRILSIFLCVAMLVSMASMTVYGVGELADQVTTENVMTLTTDKDSYAPGDTVTITVSMESIWGDPELVGDVDFNGEMAGAYGMSFLTSTLIYDTSVFTAKKHTDLLAGGGITNADANEATVSGNNPIEAKAQGAYNLLAESDFFNVDYDEYGFFTGSGDLWQYNLTIAADAAPGTYYLPVGPYVITDGKTAGKNPIVKFADDGVNDRMWAWLGNIDSFGEKRDVTYKTNYDGASRAMSSFSYVNANGDTVTIEDGTAYECGYVAITVEGDSPIDPPAPPVEEDPMEFELTTDKDGVALVPGDIITATFSVKNNEGLTDAATSTITFNNTALKLIEASTPLQTEGDPKTNFDAANKLGSFESLGTPVDADVYFDTFYATEEDVAVFVAKFEVLSTAEAGEATITVTNIETSMEASATVTVAGDHVHGFTETTTPAECTVAGKVEQICSCGLTYKTADIPRLNHKYDDNSETTYVPATCDTKGRTVIKCDVCGETARTIDEEPLGHDLKTVTTTQTCTTDGTSQDVCQREGCGYKTEIVVTSPALKHIDPETGKEAWGEPFVSKKPTTSAVGYMGKECALCKMVWDFEEIPVLAMMYGDINMDGDIKLDDVSTLLKYIAKWEGLYISLENADVKSDGRVNTLDASHLLKYIAGWDVVLGDGGTLVG